jgi:hypothetical protein
MAYESLSSPVNWLFLNYALFYLAFLTHKIIAAFFGKFFKIKYQPVSGGHARE